MKKKCFLFFLFFTLIKPESSSSVKRPQGSTEMASVNVYINNTNENNPNLSQSVFTNQETRNQLDAYLQHIKTNFNKEKIKEEIKRQAVTFWNFTYEYTKIHKGKIVVGAIGGTYLTMCSLLLYFGYKIMQRTTWSAWKDNIPYDMLHVIPHQELGKELLYAIQQQYQTSHNLTDFLTPLISFLQDVDRELSVLNQFLTLHIWIETLRLSLIFPHQENLLQNAEEKVQRLTYLREVFMHWVTDYKITLNTPPQAS